MSKSILEATGRGIKPACYICGAVRNIEEHHVFGGANRRQSEHYGLKVHLCIECHRGKKGVHNNAELSERLKKYAQKAFEEQHSHEEFMKVFGRNYLEENEWK